MHTAQLSALTLTPLTLLFHPHSIKPPKINSLKNIAYETTKFFDFFDKIFVEKNTRKTRKIGLFRIDISSAI